ncbi:MAG: 2'-5' RNA ligase family protein [Actinomycetota bacterium]|nr:2'-5' RNA ligase family protein [Actinomycetota bacterium]
MVTVEMDASGQQWFDDLRRAHFPPERLVVGAHLTLFHALPASELPRIRADLAATARRPCPTMRVTGVRFLGRGVAYEVTAPEVAQLRNPLVRDWEAVLTPQDRQPFRPHVTVQNKVDPHTARALHEQLAAQLVPFGVVAEGLALWRYRGGPWELAQRYPFGDGLRAC